MDAFSYLSVLLSIIIGLAITQILQGYRGLLLSRSTVRPYAPTIIWSALVLVFAAQLWWASFGLADHTEWSFAAFGIILLQTILLYMMSAIILPDIPAVDPVDLRDHFNREVALFFGVTLAMLATSIAKDWLLTGRLPSAANLIFHGFFGVIAVVSIVWRRPAVQHTIAATMVIFTISYIGALFAQLGQG